MAIIKYKEFFIGIQNVVYEDIHDPNKKGKRITKEAARKKIKEEGMIEVHRSEDGVIWDYPDEPFLKKFRGVEIKDI